MKIVPAQTHHGGTFGAAVYSMGIIHADAGHRPQMTGTAAMTCATTARYKGAYLA